MIALITSSVVVDIGGSGARFAGIGPKGLLPIQGKRNIRSVGELAAAIRSVSNRPSGVCISTGGFVNSRTGVVRRSWAAPWLQGHLARDLGGTLGGCPVYAMNDGEAHAAAILATPNAEFGAIAVALGTSPGFGVVGSDRRIVRPCSGENWDLGDLHLKNGLPEQRSGGRWDPVVCRNCKTHVDHAMKVVSTTGTGSALSCANLP